MVDTIIRANIFCSFYVVLYSLLSIKKLDRKVIALPKVMYGLPISMSSDVTQLPHDIDTKTLPPKNVYMRCIGEQLVNALNDKGTLGRIYKGLLQHTLAKDGGAQNLTRTSCHDYTRSPITQTLYLLKIAQYTHLQSTLNLLPTPHP